ncbi:ABC transporter ATP-binding protein [Paenibacillus sp. ISL-20]|uniref:energy-coupling factor ABC transporter ATP-binding protein n=1 Tax=Paenibacillus sp. ISL-20 TaxID=2819163 RepID=UPI001BEBDDE4|nr:ABC transporter ATP-binding protein [Paenibacillus sp. ISL-20]MBT2761993.1 ABC transporter ATP-binding protein [Paenibacillus sp. ISL-20]
MNGVRLENITYRYPNGHTAVENISMSFKQGEAVAIVGQNGAGKTTTVKLINGLLRPTEGEIYVGEWNTKDYTTAQLSKRVGYVFQNPDDQIFHSDVYSEIEFGPKNLKLPAKVVKENTQKAIELTGLEPFLKEHPYNLAYSMRKFVTIASIISMNPDVIILDEPTAGQDLPSLKRLSSIISTLQKENKIIITITHDMEFVVDNFQRVIVMANKKKIEDSDKRDIFWDFDVLERSSLKQPAISSLSHDLGMNGRILNIKEMVQQMQRI